MKKESKETKGAKTWRESETMTHQELAEILRSAASALEHGRISSAAKKLTRIVVEAARYSTTGPILSMEGGIVQDVFVLDESAPEGFRSVEHTIVDYDMFDGDPHSDIAQRWYGFPIVLQEYFRKHLTYEYGLFQEAIKEANAEECTCADRSWYGAEHNSACVLAGTPNPNSKI